MASCHAITYVHDELVGDPLEIKMFESTGWQLDEQGAASNSPLAGEEVVLAYVKAPGSGSQQQQFNSYDAQVV